MNTQIRKNEKAKKQKRTNERKSRPLKAKPSQVSTLLKTEDYKSKNQLM
jgi:hypothetical protein